MKTIFFDISTTEETVICLVDTLLNGAVIWEYFIVSVSLAVLQLTRFPCQSCLMVLKTLALWIVDK